MPLVPSSVKVIKVRAPLQPKPLDVARSLVLLPLFLWFFGVRSVPGWTSSAGSYTDLNDEPKEEHLHSAYIHTSLSSVRHWQEKLRSGNLESIDRDVIVESLVERLTWLLEVAKVPEAKEILVNLLKAERPIITRYGFHRSGMLSANVSKMLLRNPAYERYTLYIVRIENNSPFELFLKEKWDAYFVLKDGGKVKLQPLTRDHPLFQRLKRIRKSFTPPSLVGPRVIASVNLIADGRWSDEIISHLVLSLGDYTVVIKFYENVGWLNG